MRWVTFGRLAQRMDLGHTVHLKPWKAMIGGHTFPEMGVVPEPVLLTDHHSIISKSQPLYISFPLVSLHLLEGTICSF